MFSEPYIEDNSSTKDISIKFYELNEKCNFKFTTSNLEGNFEMYFTHNASNIYFQCGSNPQSDNEGICNIGLISSLNLREIYKYSEHNTLLNQDKYNLDFSSISNEFFFYGYDNINSYFGNDIYISEFGKKIFLVYYSTYEDNMKALPNIYPNNKVNTPLSQCKLEDSGNFKIIVCDINSNEFSYFSTSNSLPLSYNILCGYKESVDARVSVLDTKKYPVIIIKRLILDNKGYFENLDNFQLIADIEGSVSQLKNESLSFLGIIEIEYNNKLENNIILCEIDNPKIGNDFIIYCTVLSFYRIYQYIFKAIFRFRLYKARSFSSNYWR